MDTFFKHYGAAGLAMVSVIFCIWVLFGGATGNKTATSLKVQFDRLDKRYASVEMKDKAVGEDAVKKQAEKKSPATTYHNEGRSGTYWKPSIVNGQEVKTPSSVTTNGIYTNTEYKINDLFSSKDMETEADIPSQTVRVSYIMTDESSAEIRRLIANRNGVKNENTGEWYLEPIYDGHDNTSLINEGESKQVVDAVNFALVKIDQKGTEAKNKNTTYMDDTITFRFKGDYIVSIYSQKTKRVVREFDVHVLKTPNVNY